MSRGRSTRAALALCTTIALFLLAFLPDALAAPIHPRLESLDISGLNHACGAAVDSKGDVYVSSADESKVKVFGPEHKLLKEISNSNEPCGLTVDSKGNLYVSEAKTGNVVRYVPNAYPLTASPTYGAAEPVGEAGEAQGISVDPTDDSLYVAKGNRVESYRNELQEFRVVFATGGTYKLSFKGEETAALAFNATDAQVQVALEALPAIGAGNASVSPSSENGHRIAFVRARGLTDVPQVKVVSSLTGNTVQEVKVAATAGTYKLTFEGEQTAAIPYNAPASGAGSLKEALEALADVAPGDVAVSGGPGDEKGTSPYVVTFEGAYAAKTTGFLFNDSSGLTGTVSVSFTAGAETRAGTPVSGGRGVDESQQISVTHALGGTYKLSFEGEETAPIAYNAPASKAEGAGSVEAALEGLASIGPGKVTVLGGRAPTYESRVYNVGFSGALAAKDVPRIKAVSSLSPNEVQKVTVKASAGTYTLTPTTAGGIGSTTSGSKTVSGVEAAFGAFHAGDEIEGEGIPAGATVAAVGAGTLELSAATTIVTTESTLRASETTAPVAFNASAASLQGALEALAGIGPGDVSVGGGPGDVGGTNPYTVAFEGTFAGHNVRQMSRDQAGLTGTTTVSTQVEGADVSVLTTEQGFGNIGEGTFSDATGVSSYTSNSASQASNRRRYIGVADAGTDKLETLVGRFDNQKGNFVPGTLEALGSVDGAETPAGELGLGATAALGVDPKSGHVFAYDATHKVVNEFEATGQYFTRVVNSSFEDAKPTAMAVDRSSGGHDGSLYVTSGSGPGAKLLAFGPVAAPSRLTLPEPPSEKFSAPCGTAVDSAGDVYIAGESAIKVYAPEPQLKEGKPQPLATIPDSGHPCDLAVDSKGDLYAAERGKLGNEGDESVAIFKPSEYPFSGSPAFSKDPTPVETIEQPRGIAVNPANDHLFVVHAWGPKHDGVHEYDSAAKGSTLLKSNFCGLLDLNMAGIDVYGSNGDVYVVESKDIAVCSPSGVLLANINGGGSPGGTFTSLNGTRLAVDQTNGHVLIGLMESRGAVEEYDASGSFVAQVGTFSKVSQVQSDLAIDDSEGPTKGDLYVGYLNNLTAFGPLAYGEPPSAVTGMASDVGGGSATLSATLNPRGFDLTTCRFEYVTDSQYLANGKTFASASSASCDESLAEIGKGFGPVSVHASIGGLDPEGRYRFRLFAENKFGSSAGDAFVFGPPVITVGNPRPILYREATLHGEVDPSGLETEYRFEYGFNAGEYDQSTPSETLSGKTEASPVEAFPAGLAEGTTYHYRLVAENEAAAVTGPDQELTTQEKHPELACPNATLRLESSSSNLPDCRAYELATPADTRGPAPTSGGDVGGYFNNWFVTPRGPDAGESLTFLLEATLPGAEGNGFQDGFRATRGSTGWSSQLFGPSFAQNGSLTTTTFHDVSADQLYSIWKLGSETPGALPHGTYLGTPTGFEAVGIGALGTDLHAHPRYVSPGASHVIFESGAQLEADAPASPLTAVYDRSPGGPTQVLSLLPGDVTPTSGARFKGSTFDGSSVVFAIDENFYLRRNGTETIKVTSSPATFAGLSDDGDRVFYAKLDNPSNLQSYGTLYAFDADGGGTTKIAEDAKFVVVSSDGSRAYFTKEGNLYLWDGAGTTFVAELAPEDLADSVSSNFPGTDNSPTIALDSWTAYCAVKDEPEHVEGRADCPVRTSPDGRFLVFQSHADLTLPYEGEGHSEVYRYDAEDGDILCVSCDPSGVSATAESDLESLGIGRPNRQTTLIPGVSDDGGEVFFQTPAPLLPEDANSVSDVYEWQAEGAGGCARLKGCLALISSGQSDESNYLYSMTPDGHDVFFLTREKLVDSDIASSPSIYDARVDGGFPAKFEKEPCHGDACQGEGSTPPELPTIGTQAPGSGNVEETSTPPPCAKGKRRVKGRCVVVHKHRKRHHRRARHNRGAER